MTRRVALVAPAGSYVGPSLARVLASRGFDLVLADPTTGLSEDLEAAGARTVVVDHRGDDPDDPDGRRASAGELGRRMVEAAHEHFGTYHSAFFSSGRIALGRFVRTSIDDLRAAFRDNVEAPFEFVQAVVGPLVERGDGQVLVATSATSGKPTPSASLYAGTRSAATVMLQSLGLEVAATGVQVNVVGTNFMDFPEFLRGNRIETPQDRARVEAMVPMKRLGTMVEFASFCATFLDGTSRFATGQFFPYAGGWAL